MFSGTKRAREDVESGSDSDDESGESMYSDNGAPRTKMNCPHGIANIGWVGDWTIKEAVRELVANMVDQSRTVAREFLLDPSKIKIIEEHKKLIVQIGERKLAEATWKVEKSCRFVREYVEDGLTKARMTVAKEDRVDTQVIHLTNFHSILPWNSFFSGTTNKRDNKDVIGTHGEGLSAASVVLTRLGCNLSAVCTQSKFTATVGALDDMVCFQVKYKKASTSANPHQPRHSVRFRIVLNPDEGGLKMDIGALMAQIRLPVAVSAAGIATSRGILILDKDYRGKQYNRSIFVADGANCLFGYDLHDPDKNLLQGRDRNCMKQQNLLAECGAILSEAILSTPEVCHRVLQALKYPVGYKPGMSKDELKRYEDLTDGEHLSPQALQALRHAERKHLAHPKAPVFCAHVPPALQAIVEHLGLSVVYTHPVLHNHEAVRADFYQSLARSAQFLSKDLRVGAHQQRIAELLKVDEILHAKLAHACGRCTFWRQGNVLYVTSPEQLGAASTFGFKEAQEVALYMTLQTCKAEEESVVRIMRLLREGHERDSPAVSTPSAKVTESSSAAQTKAGSSAGGTAAASKVLTKPSPAPKTSTLVSAAPVAASSVIKTEEKAKALPVPDVKCGVQTVVVNSETQTEVPPVAQYVTTGNNPHVPYPAAAPPPPIVAHGTSQTDECVAASPAGSVYTQHGPSGMWLRGTDSERHDTATTIEDFVQTEESQRRLRRLARELFIVASLERPMDLPK